MINWASLSGTNTSIPPVGERDLSEYGFRNLVRTCWNFEAAQLVEMAIRHREGLLASNGALVVRTGQFTGRSPRDKYVVRDASTESSVNWGKVNQPMDEEAFNRMYAR